MECKPIYALKGSPVNESPLSLFAPEQYAGSAEADFGIPRRYLTGIMSPWGNQAAAGVRPATFPGSRVRVQPQGCARSLFQDRAGDENIRTFPRWSGKVDIRMLDRLLQSIPTYSYTGGLCLANQGLLEFVEMSKGAESRCCIRC